MSYAVPDTVLINLSIFSRDFFYIISENFEMNNKNEVTPDGFLNLNIMEAKDADGGVDELWVSIESMGYNQALELVKVGCFRIEFLYYQLL